MSYTPRIATQTLVTIAAHLERDQGAAYRRHLRHLMPQAEDAYRDEEDDFRSHLGASLIGRECARELWYSFRWTTKPSFDGRILRLFNRGHLEEPRMVALLLMIGCTVWQFDEEGNQFRIKGHKGHFGGGMDGVILGVPEIPDEPVLGEFKTHNDKSFQKLKGDGVREAKFEHYVQMQMYMGKNGFRWALYMAINKNDDELYAELVAFDQVTYDRFLDRSAMVIDAVEPPPRINNSPGWYKCKFCDFCPVCHGATMPAKNCRTCRWSTPVDGGKWVCENPKVIEVLKEQGYHDDQWELTKEAQLRGCDDYELHPLIKAKQ